MSGTVIVGASLAGVRTAQALRREGYDQPIVLVGDERELPYDRPPLSKSILLGDQKIDDVRLLSAEAAAEDDIELMLGRRAERLDVPASRLHLGQGGTVSYGTLVIATGAAARPSPWGRLPGLHVVRTAEDARELREDLLRGGPVVVIGGGFIGAEVASAARRLGLEVTIVDRGPALMSRVLGAEMGEHFLDLHRRHGVRTRLGVGVADVVRNGGGLTVMLTDGTVLPAVTVVVGIGATPNTDWLATAGLAIDDGVVCDEFGRVAGAAGVYAVGDVARWRRPRTGQWVRVEHWTNAVEQAAVVAHNVAAPEDQVTHDPIEYVWSDQHDWKIQVAGSTSGACAHRLIGEPGQDRRFACVYTRDGGSLSGVVTVNWPQATVLCRRGMAEGAGFGDTVERLAGLHARQRS